MVSLLGRFLRRPYVLFRLWLESLLPPRKSTNPLSPHRSGLQAVFFDARERGDWAVAEDTCRQLIALNDFPMALYRDWWHLAGILEQQGRSDEAYQAILASTRAARDSKLNRLIIMALQHETDGAAHQGERKRAYACIEEGLRRSARDDFPLPWDQARFLVRRARLRLEDGEAELAMLDLQKAEPRLFKSQIDGVLPICKIWWEIIALLRLAQGNTLGAKAAGQEALRLGRRIAEFPQLAEFDRRQGLRRTLERFAELHENLGESEVAEAARQEASAIK
ncbi:hypothetical protein [Armatimonas sp.]|uniref:hypothetical protein n=1 Tax=Armatimonas sp. TaxID=1872638 RepID=UPI0037528FF7